MGGTAIVPLTGGLAVEAEPVAGGLPSPAAAEIPFAATARQRAANAIIILKVLFLKIMVSPRLLKRRTILKVCVRLWFMAA
jgi:hypothetical protein